MTVVFLYTAARENESCNAFREVKIQTYLQFLHFPLHADSQFPKYCFIYFKLKVKEIATFLL